MVQRLVRTIEELEKAVEDKVDSIIVCGELAETLNTALKLESASKWTLSLLTISLVATPVTGGLSLIVALPLAALTGIDIVAIIAISTVGISTVLKILTSYKKVNFSVKIGNTEAKLSLESKDKK